MISFKQIFIVVLLMVGVAASYLVVGPVPEAAAAEIADPEDAGSTDADTMAVIAPPTVLQELGLRNIFLYPIDREFGDRFGVPVTEGLLVVPITGNAPPPDSAAWPKPWDIIVTCNEQQVFDLESFLFIAEKQPVLHLKIFRRGAFLNLPVTVRDAETLTNEMVSKQREYADEAEREFIVYHIQGEDPWDETFKRLEEGSGRITGTITIAGEPAGDLKISLLLAGSQRTQRAKVEPDGRFEVRLPPGSYYYLGYALSGKRLSESLIPVDRNLSPSLNLREEPPLRDGDRVMERLSELTAKFGEEKAGKMLEEEFASEFAWGERYPLEVDSFEAATIPPIVFREPVRIIAPLANSSVSLDQLRFAWASYERAASYIAEIHLVTKEGRTTSYRPIAHNVVEENVLDVADLSFTAPSPPEDAASKEFVPGCRYGLKVFAYDENGNLLSASSRYDYSEFVIK